MAKSSSKVSILGTEMTKAQAAQLKKGLRSGIQQFVFYLRVITAIKLILFGIFFFYLREMRLSKCQCAENWKRDFLTFATGYIFLYQLALLAQPLLGAQYPFLSLLDSLVSVAFLVTAVIYIQDLKKSKCNCSEKWERTTMEVYVYFTVAVVAMTVVMSLIGLFNSR